MKALETELREKKQQLALCEKSALLERCNLAEHNHRSHCGTKGASGRV